MTKSYAFTKMTGAGNDFIIMEAPVAKNVNALAQKVCARTTGIGADGLLLLDKSRKADFRMRIINADGSEAEMCGNGARCLAAYIRKHHKTAKPRFSLETIAGIIWAEVKNEMVSVQLSNPSGLKLDIPLNIHGQIRKVHYIDTGVPHAVVYVNALSKIAVNVIGPQIRYHKRFAPRGVNVNFVEQINNTLVAVRTYERGLEAETRACGTGSVAAALISSILGNPDIKQLLGTKIRVRTASGEVLLVAFDFHAPAISNVWLTGSAHLIAQGQYFT